VNKTYQNKKIDTSQPVETDTVSMALAELAGEMREGLLTLASRRYALLSAGFGHHLPYPGLVRAGAGDDQVPGLVGGSLRPILQRTPASEVTNTSIFAMN